MDKHERRWLIVITCLCLVGYVLVVLAKVQAQALSNREAPVSAGDVPLRRNLDDFYAAHQWSRLTWSGINEQATSN